MSSEYSLCTLSPLLCLLFSPSATTVAHWLPSLSFCSRSPWWGHQGHLYCQIQPQFSGLILLDICCLWQCPSLPLPQGPPLFDFHDSEVGWHLPDSSFSVSLDFSPSPFSLLLRASVFSTLVSSRTSLGICFSPGISLCLSLSTLTSVSAVQPSHLSVSLPYPVGVGTPTSVFIHSFS